LKTQQECTVMSSCNRPAIDQNLELLSFTL
jgi:hypothetical protein